MLGAGTGFCKYTNDIAQRLARLVDQIVAVEGRLGIPANLTRNEDLAALDGDAVRVAFRLDPLGRIESASDTSAKFILYIK